MQLALDSARIRAAEQRAVAQGVPLEELMERAGQAVAAEAALVAPGSAGIVVVTGKGNNGGDGWVAARSLRESGRDVLVLSTCDPEDLPEPASGAAVRAIGAGVPWRLVREASGATDDLAGAGLVIDALLGIGLSGDVR
jgi:hydroxyethylthiazole kinase-like uncharacterized protein yjeF